MATTKIDRSAIYGAAGDSQWATTNNLTLSQPELASIVRGFSDPSELQASGLHVQGQKYFCIKADDRSIYGKQVSFFSFPNF